jgi:hypothetical protein
MTEKRQTSQGYIIRILQHFATKLRNITNFVLGHSFVPLSFACIFQAVESLSIRRFLVLLALLTHTGTNCLFFVT